MLGTEVRLSGLKSYLHYLIVTGKLFNMSRSPYLHHEKGIITAPTLTGLMCGLNPSNAHLVPGMLVDGQTDHEQSIAIVIIIIIILSASSEPSSSHFLNTYRKGI